MDDLVQRLYADRDHQSQGGHYLRHVSAMTAEGLHAKSEIAGELAHRDMEIERLRAERAQRVPLTADAALELATKEFPYWREDIQTAFVLQLIRAVERAHGIGDE